MWKNYLKSHLLRSLKQEPFGPHLRAKIKEQFKRMTPLERWTAMSLIENNKLVQINNKEKSAEEVEEFLEEEFEDTIYVCEQCGSKKIDIYQKQLRSAVSVFNIYVLCFFSLCFASTGRTGNSLCHLYYLWGEVDGELI